MNRMVKKLMVVLLSAFMFMGALTTPVQAKGNSNGTNGWNPWGGWNWGWGWGWQQPTEPEPEVEETPVEIAYPANELSDYIGNTTVTVVVPEGALPEGTTMELAEVSLDAVQNAVDSAADIEGTVVAAVDITFYDANGDVVEPLIPITVTMTSEEIANEGNLKVVHVDTTADEIEEADVEAEAIEAEIEENTVIFDADQFSVYAIIWTVDDVEQKAYIHWGIDEEDGFKDLTTPTTIDSTASSVDINIIIDAEKYYFIGADYKLTEDAEDFENLKSTVLHNVDGVWQVSLDSGTVPLANESHIYVHYAPYTEAEPYVAPDPPGPDVLAPDTEKSVTDNEDGTYTIRLDIEGKSDHSTTRVGANVIVVMDVTQSMTNSMSGGGTRMAAAKQAVRTLINTLDPDTNLINFRAINFGDNAQPYDYNASTASERGVNWTTQKTVMQGYADGLPDNPDDFGTCWQAGLRGGYNIVNTEVAGSDDLRKNATYVVFVTDGNPNCYAANNDGTGRWTGASGPGYNATAYNRAAYWANLLGPACNFYGVYCGNSSDSGMGYLRNLITAANGSDANFIDGTSASAIESAFENIATTIVNNLGAGGVTVDDGIPTLSNVSANVSAGEAGGFKYYIKPVDGTETEWVKGATGDSDPGAPGATYSQTNGVTWDLGEAGELKNGWIYSLEFTVWPSQAAYDLIADLNNGLREYDELTPEEKAAVQGNKTDGYTLLTNTHLYTTFVDLEGTEYREVNDASPEAMPLPAPAISVEKLWNNFLDGRTDEDIDGLQLVLSRDGEDYYEFDVNSPEWKKDGIYISCGQIVDGEIFETGHDYYVTEKPREDVDKTEYWEVNSPYYHPMVVDGEMKLFVQDDNAATPAFEVNGHKYVAADGSSTNLVAINERVSWLNLTKVVEGDDVPADTLFKYNVTINEPVNENSDEEMSIFFSVRGGGMNYRDDIETNATKWVDPTTGNTYYYAENGSEIWLKIKAGWNARFLNLATDSEYSITEVEEEMEPGFVFVSAKNEETFYSAYRVPATGYPITTTESETTQNGAVVSGSTVTGRVNQTNTDYSVTYTNEYLGFFYVYHSANKTVERFPMAVNGVQVTDFNIAERTADGTLYGGYYKDYAGKSSTFDVKELEFTNDVADDEGEDAKAYTYQYIKDSALGAWTTPYTEEKGFAIDPVKDTVYYLKEVPEGYLQPYLHYTYYKANGGICSVWLISDIDDNNYPETGFVIINDDEEALRCKSLTVQTTNGGNSVKLTPKRVFSSKGVLDGYLTYKKVIELRDGSDALLNEGDKVLQYWVTPDGLHVTGTTERTYKGLDNISGAGVDTQTIVDSVITDPDA